LLEKILCNRLISGKVMQHALVTSGPGREIGTCFRVDIRFEISSPPVVIVESSADSKGVIEGSLSASLSYRMTGKNFHVPRRQFQPLNTASKIIEGNLSKSEPFLMEVLKVQLQTGPVGTECITRIASLIEVFQVSCNGFNQAPFVIQDHIANTLIRGENFCKPQENSLPPPHAPLSKKTDLVRDDVDYLNHSTRLVVCSQAPYQFVLNDIVSYYKNSLISYS
jgi:hypothetical protein